MSRPVYLGSEFADRMVLAILDLAIEVEAVKNSAELTPSRGRDRSEGVPTGTADSSHGHESTVLRISKSLLGVNV